MDLGAVVPAPLQRNYLHQHGHPYARMAIGPNSDQSYLGTDRLYRSADTGKATKREPGTAGGRVP